MTELTNYAGIIFSLGILVIIAVVVTVFVLIHQDAKEQQELSQRDSNDEEGSGAPVIDPPYSPLGTGNNYTRTTREISPRADLDADPENSSDSEPEATASGGLEPEGQSEDTSADSSAACSSDSECVDSIDSGFDGF